MHQQSGFVSTLHLLTMAALLPQVTEARAALKQAEAAVTAAKAEADAATEQERQLATDITLAQEALKGGSLGGHDCCTTSWLHFFSKAMLLSVPRSGWFTELPGSALWVPPCI